jgi:hypothetical protein
MADGAVFLLLNIAYWQDVHCGFWFVNKSVRIEMINSLSVEVFLPTALVLITKDVEDLASHGLKLQYRWRNTQSVWKRFSSQSYSLISSTQSVW